MLTVNNDMLVYPIAINRFCITLIVSAGEHQKFKAQQVIQQQPVFSWYQKVCHCLDSRTSSIPGRAEPGAHISGHCMDGCRSGSWLLKTGSHCSSMASVIAVIAPHWLNHSATFMYTRVLHHMLNNVMSHMQSAMC